jgi:hypothetical protein
MAIYNIDYTNYSYTTVTLELTANKFNHTIRPVKAKDPRENQVPY